MNLAKFLFTAYFFIYGQTLTSQTHLFGKVQQDSLKKFEWYNQNFEKYSPDPDVVNALKKQNLKDHHVRIFFGTWCGDTKRELPKLMKVLTQISFPYENISFYAVSSADSIYKQSKHREEKGLNIFRVGTFIIEKNRSEINRIVEYPRYSMEVDLLKIISGHHYIPQYESYIKINEWLQDGTLTAANISAYNLASQIKQQTTSSSELNACGYVLMADKKYKEALKVFQINSILFPDNSNCWHSLAECSVIMMDKDQSLKSIEQGLKVNKSVDLVKPFLDLYQKALSL